MQDDKKPVPPEPLTRGDFVIQVLHGIGIAAGLALLWAMEAVRDRVFRLLDRLNISPPRWRKANPFPPGYPSQQR